MDLIKQAITDWLREILTGGIISNLTGMFDAVNQRVGEIAFSPEQYCTRAQVTTFLWRANKGQPRADIHRQRLC